MDGILEEFGRPGRGVESDLCRRILDRRFEGIQLLLGVFSRRAGPVLIADGFVEIALLESREQVLDGFPLNVEPVGELGFRDFVLVDNWPLQTAATTFSR